MGTNPAPDDVRFALEYSVAVLERGPPIVRPRHFEQSRCALYALDPQALSKPPTLAQILDEIRNHGDKRRLLSRGKAVEVRAEPSEPCEGRHRRSALA